MTLIKGDIHRDSYNLLYVYNEVFMEKMFWEFLSLKLENYLGHAVSFLQRQTCVCFN